MSVNKITYLVNPSKVSEYYMKENFTTLPVIEINGFRKIDISKDFPNPDAFIMVKYKDSSAEVLGERLSRTITEYYIDNDFNKKPLFYLFPNSNIVFSTPSIVPEKDINNIIIREDYNILKKFLNPKTFNDFMNQYNKILLAKLRYLNKQPNSTK